MAIGDKYLKLTQYLRGCEKDKVSLSFAEIEKICTLPPSAYSQRSLWGNSGQSFSSSWMNAGYKTKNVRMQEQRVEFIRSSCSENDNRTLKINKRMNQDVITIVNCGYSCLNEMLSDEHHRYRSWEYCYAAFRKAYNGSDDQADYLALHLSWYLGSWGMLRNSFLQAKDYRVQIPVVKLLMEPRYDKLREMRIGDLTNEVRISEILHLSNELKIIYQTNAGGTPTDTLISKVLLGTLGCVPAYDRYLVGALRSTKIASGIFGKQSLLQLGEFYEENSDKLEELRVKCSENGVQYTPAKVLDMCFFGYGIQTEGME